MLIHAGVLCEPLLYLSPFFKQHRQTCYDLLDKVRKTRKWEAWLDFFLQGVAETAEGAESTAQRIYRMFDDDEEVIQTQVRAPASALESTKLSKNIRWPLFSL